MSFSMTKEEREAFLAETHVGVISVSEAGRGPLSVPVWYSYQPGTVVRFVTGRSSHKAGLIAAARRLSLCAQTEVAPYKYVSVEGPATLGEANFERDIRAMAHRYLGEQLGEAYLQMNAAENANTVLITLSPQRWLSVDYSKMGV
jgi:nitroimidazol reductase NimA-like FMN-containing flavoprotein (pyridoxamine 5'-phosphate oxidase superfamily)